MMKPLIRWQHRIVMLLVVFTYSLFAQAKEPDAAERKFISQGMQQGEVVSKIGMPDYQNSYERPQPCYSVIDGETRRQQVVITQCGPPIKVEVWTYNPAPHDHQTMTVITFENGVVSFIKRDISR